MASIDVKYRAERGSRILECSFQFSASSSDLTLNNRRARFKAMEICDHGFEHCSEEEEIEWIPANRIVEVVITFDEV